MAKSEKPTDQIVMEIRPDGQEVAIHNALYGGPGGRTVFQAAVPLTNFVLGLARGITQHAPLNLDLVPAGMTLRWAERMNGWYVFMVEEAPGTHTVQWIRDDSRAGYGPSATYHHVTLAFPWLYFFVVLAPNGRFSNLNSVYFRNRPLTSLNDQLCDPHFFNCAVDAYGVHCWICTQYAHIKASRTLLSLVDAFMCWFWSSGFNASSEAHELEKGSFWTYNRDRIVDTRVQSISAWEKASRVDPGFAVTVPWVEAGHTPLTVSKELTASGAGQPEMPCTVHGFANLIKKISDEEEDE